MSAQNNDVDAVEAALRPLMPLPDRSDRWAHFSLCVVDAVFSIGARYSTTRRTVESYATHAGLPQVTGPAAMVSQGAFTALEEPISALRQRIEQYGPQEFAEIVLRNRQRTSARNGVLKAAAVLGYAQVLERHGIDRLADAASLLVAEDRLRAVEADLATVPGHGTGGVRMGYLWMLVGSDDHIKPDRMVLGWLSDVLARQLGTVEARGLLAAAADRLGVTAWQVDHAIWEAQRRRPRPGSTSERIPSARPGTRNESVVPDSAGVSRRCMRCSKEPQWMVGAGTVGPSRLLVYCDECRLEYAPHLGFLIPLPMVDADPDGVLSALYRSGSTLTPPEYVANALGLAHGRWWDEADKLIG
jgi:hypothetical protein